MTVVPLATLTLFFLQTSFPKVNFCFIFLELLGLNAAQVISRRFAQDFFKNLKCNIGKISWWNRTPTMRRPDKWGVINMIVSLCYEKPSKFHNKPIQENYFFENMFVCILETYRKKTLKTKKKTLQVSFLYFFVQITNIALKSNSHGKIFFS